MLSGELTIEASFKIASKTVNAPLLVWSLLFNEIATT